jgi:hypothetical protein
MPVLDPDGLAEITGFLAEDFFARSGGVIDPDGVREILSTDGVPRQVIIYKSGLDQLASVLTITAESVIFDQDGRVRYKTSFLDDTEMKRSIFKFPADE